MMNFFEDQSVWQALKTCKKPIVLYGMGDGADKVIDAFERFGITISAVMASDDFVRGQSFHGFTVKKLSDLEDELGDFVVALCFASQLPDVMEHIRFVASRHRLLVPSVPAFGDVLFDEKFIENNREKCDAAREIFADEQSKIVYDNVLRFYHTGELSLLDEISTPKDEAFLNILCLNGSETYLDLGAYNGDTIDEFLHYSGGAYDKIIALEPNGKNFAKLQIHCENMKNNELFQLGAWSKDDVLTFNNKAGRNSAIAENGVQTRVTAVDTLLNGQRVSYVKADVEGADHETLLGMARTIEKYKPKLNFAAYHRFEDIFRLPLLIKKLNPDYKIFLRHHPYYPAWDTNLYCI